MPMKTRHQIKKENPKTASKASKVKPTLFWNILLQHSNFSHQTVFIWEGSKKAKTQTCQNSRSSVFREHDAHVIFLCENIFFNMSCFCWATVALAMLSQWAHFEAKTDDCFYRHALGVSKYIHEFKSRASKFSKRSS